MTFCADTIFQKIKKKHPKYIESTHCPMVLRVMSSKDGSLADFLIEAVISETTFYKWLRIYHMFNDCYEIAKSYARRNWEREGEELKYLQSHEVGCRFEHWRLIGWSRYGVGKNSRIRLNLTENGTPHQHYHDLLKQASEGCFTAGEIKQLMEAINVGLSAHQVFELQREIDELKANLEKMEANRNGLNTIADQAIEKTNSDTVEDSVCEKANTTK